MNFERTNTMPRYSIWYMRPAHFREGISGAMPDARDLELTHVELRSIEADGLDAAFAAMQGENWSPNGEARPLIEEKGLQHTSMSMGDIAVDDVGNIHVVARMGWRCVGNTRSAGR